jgi:sphinganine C4-monooxygenase
MANALNSTMSNATYLSDLPPLPSYTLVPLKSLMPWIADMHLSLLLPIAAYWILSLTFHYIDVNDYWPQYRLHTPAEITKRNHVSRYEVIRDVIIQQCIQTGLGLALSFLDPEELTGQDDYNVAVWAQRIRLAQRALPQVLGVLGLNALDLSKNVAASHPVIAGALAGGKYPYATDMLSGSTVAAFAGWELQLASAIYWYLVPAVQFGLAIFVLDTWEYFLHRAMHMNKWLYSTYCVSSMEDSELTLCSHFPLPPPSSLCSIRLRSSLQPPIRGVPP